ncbi:hypothetical protein ASPZODRAFT_1158448 [Penicilliopsis zonata CBS 506.65]|uniref:Uncharacterized protein n=1 Tax=Penicilliopsis zonata CBS 506.65 TaxID=1073090 RepID=A0A1L9ST63_9EURO|nr:hypothetical protein ASPZODRAFT_1158448 [Penicilliopsis zonata CBS 506.65]OJJ50389.1 hypothetical protein ASPZODRAFT_1158448 [Penicilliopsis zonata CBS 506.65]
MSVHIRVITRNLPHIYQHQPRSKTTVTAASSSAAAAAHEKKQQEVLAYRLSEISLLKMRAEALSREPDLRHVVGNASINRVANNAVHEDLMQRIAAFERRQRRRREHRKPVPVDKELDIESVNAALLELEIAGERGRWAHTLCSRRIEE